MTEQEFNQLAQQGYNRIPLALETLADLDTPLSLYLKLANQPYTYLLESVEGGERFGRYSFIGLPAKTRIVVRGRNIAVESDSGTLEQTEASDPLQFIQAYMARLKVPARPGQPRFSGGLAGYFGYDTIRYVEKKLAHASKPDVIGAPDILLLLSDELAVMDNLSGKIYLIVYADPGQPNAYALGQQRLAALRGMLRKPVEIPAVPASCVQQARSEFGEEAFKAAVAKAKNYITDGDIMQVVLSQRMSQPYAASPLSLYRALRTLNPSPYMFYYDMGDHHVVGASPEILVQ
ncbi:MAG: chorismate-binding protein, partial [Sulfurimicrobium sp.]